MINKQLSVFNPDNDLALANWDANYMPPVSARRMATDLALLPAWYATGGGVLAPSAYNLAFLKEMRQRFSLPVELVTEAEDLSSFDAVMPWGWNLALRKKLLGLGLAEDALPSPERLEELRRFSHRRQAVSLLSRLRLDGSFCGESVWLTALADCRAYVESREAAVLKAPWSGSGKGLYWCKGVFTPHIEQWCARLIERQGGVVGEPVYNKVEDFAMEFFIDGAGRAAFAGYSFFHTGGSGAYEGNLLLPDEAIERRLAAYVPLAELQGLQRVLAQELSARFGGAYRGYLGVDMMICQVAHGHCVHPCVEINLRMNMGVVSRLLYDRFVVPGRSGVFRVAYCPVAGEALREHEAMQTAYPLQTENGRVASGYLPLVPVGKSSLYRAWVLVEA